LGARGWRRGRGQWPTARPSVDTSAAPARLGIGRGGTERAERGQAMCRGITRERRNGRGVISRGRFVSAPIARFSSASNSPWLPASRSQPSGGRLVRAVTLGSGPSAPFGHSRPSFRSHPGVAPTVRLLRREPSERARCSDLAKAPVGHHRGNYLRMHDAWKRTWPRGPAYGENQVSRPAGARPHSPAHLRPRQRALCHGRDHSRASKARPSYRPTRSLTPRR
jgi:hypothetical protein